mmetsp:Transcript_29420/g.69988  ORF Transcript_29420/g.69988 Transcript_29420/m.69988 type:complete len:294 (+) Transcript_29420:4280-5161(+)
MLDPAQGLRQAVGDHVVGGACHQLQFLCANLEANVVPTHVDVLGPLAKDRLASQENAGRVVLVDARRGGLAKAQPSEQVAEGNDLLRRVASRDVFGLGSRKRNDRLSLRAPGDSSAVEHHDVAHRRATRDCIVGICSIHVGIELSNSMPSLGQNLGISGPRDPDLLGGDHVPKDPLESGEELGRRTGRVPCELGDGQADVRARPTRQEQKTAKELAVFADQIRRRVGIAVLLANREAFIHGGLHRMPFLAAKGRRKFLDVGDLGCRHAVAALRVPHAEVPFEVPFQSDLELLL